MQVDQTVWTAGHTLPDLLFLALPIWVGGREEIRKGDNDNG